MFNKTTMRRSLTAALAATLLASTVGVQAQTVTLSMVPVGDPGNAADSSTGYGAVGYNYDIGKYDVTLSQYTAFLNAVATKSDPYGLYYSGMATDMPTVGISQTLVSGSYSYAVSGTAAQKNNMPAFEITWGDAARFCNWLDNGQPTSGTEAAGTTETGAYTLSGDTTSLMETRNAGAAYFIPSENEWYKAAYFDPTLNGGSGGYWQYPTKSNNPPINILSSTATNNANFYDYFGTGTELLNGQPYTDTTDRLTPVGSFSESPGPWGTYDMSGDVWQWNEANMPGGYRGVRGGSWSEYSGFMASPSRSGSPPTLENYGYGFRVASTAVVPEPGSLALLLAGAAALGIWRLRRKT